MKKVLILFLTALLLVSLAACGKNYQSRTAEFYGEINQDCFYYKGYVTANGTTYYYTQAVDEDSVTTIEDHPDDDEDGYVIYDGTLLHSLDVDRMRYDTLKTTNGVNLIFAVNEYKEFNNPTSVNENAVFNGEVLYCETFTTIDENGKAAGENSYYFRDKTLVGIEWSENGKVTNTLVILEYSNSIPEDIYTSIPDGFKAGTYTAEEIIDPSDFWGD